MSDVAKNVVIAVIFLGMGVAAGNVMGTAKMKNSGATSVTASVEKEVEKSGPIAAVVNGSKIYKSEVMNTIDKLSVKQEDVDKIYSAIVNQMVTDKLISDKVGMEGIRESADFKQKMSDIEKQVVKSIYFEKLAATEVSEDEIKKEYDIIKANNQGKKEARARHILVKTQAEADQVIKDLNKGVEFEKLAKERSADATAERGGELGYFTEGEVLPEISKIVFTSLKKGEFTKKPIQTALGFHIIQLEDLRDREVPAFDEVKDSIKSSLVQKNVFEAVRDMRQEAKVTMYDFEGNPIKSVEGAPAPAAEAPVAKEDAKK